MSPEWPNAGPVSAIVCSSPGLPFDWSGNRKVWNSKSDWWSWNPIDAFVKTQIRVMPYESYELEFLFSQEWEAFWQRLETVLRPKLGVIPMECKVCSKHCYPQWIGCDKRGICRWRFQITFMANCEPRNLKHPSPAVPSWFQLTDSSEALTSGL